MKALERRRETAGAHEPRARSTFCVAAGEVIHHCGGRMSLRQRGFAGEERWFCTGCLESVYIPGELSECLVPYDG